MKPFDLEKALAGEAVVTRYGIPVKNIRIGNSAWPVFGDVENLEEKWKLSGTYYSVVESEYDLFMADTQPPDYAIPAEATGIEAELCRMFTERQAFGIKKYGVTVEDNPLSLREWLHHALLESMDHCVYLLRAIKEIDKKEGK